MGNPDVKPEQTVQYEIGYRQALTTRSASTPPPSTRTSGISSASSSSRPTTTPSTRASPTSIFGNVVGVTLSMDFVEYGPLANRDRLHVQQATGNSKRSARDRDRAEAGEDPRPREIPFNWDQRHTFNSTITYAEPRYSLSAIIRAASGQPYTPVLDAGYGFGLEANSGASRPGFCSICAAQCGEDLRHADQQSSDGPSTFSTATISTGTCSRARAVPITRASRKPTRRRWPIRRALFAAPDRVRGSVWVRRPCEDDRGRVREDDAGGRMHAGLVAPRARGAPDRARQHLAAAGGVPTPVPPTQRGQLDAERSGSHDANGMRTVFWNYGMVGDYPADPRMWT